MKYFLRIAFSILIAGFSPLHLFALATDTIWLNKQNIETKQVAERHHYKIAGFNKDKTAFVESFYNLNGQHIVTMSYSSPSLDVKHGDFIFYDDNGQLKNRINFRHDTVMETFTYKDGKQIEHLINKNHPPIPPSDDPDAKYTELGKVFSSNSANYPRLRYDGGEKAISDFLSKNIIYPPLAKKNKIQGRVLIRFSISATGSVMGIEILPPSVDKLLKEEALRVARLLPPKWIPGKDDKGNPEEDTYSIPLSFSL